MYSGRLIRTNNSAHKGEGMNIDRHMWLYSLAPVYMIVDKHYVIDITCFDPMHVSEIRQWKNADLPYLQK